jgi:hypothetical protein
MVERHEVQYRTWLQRLLFNIPNPKRLRHAALSKPFLRELYLRGSEG